MARRNWKGYRASNLREAMKACLDFAEDRHNRGTERVADLMGESQWSLYKWVANGNLPLRLVRPFEHACGCQFVTEWMAASAHRLLIEFPTGRRASPADVHDLQDACNGAVGALIAFARGESTQTETLAAITTAMERLAYEHAQVSTHAQPELSL